MSAIGRDRWLDRTWAAVCVLLAAASLKQATVDESLEAALAFAVHGLTAILFWIRRPARPGGATWIGATVALGSMTYVYLFDYGTTTPANGSAILALVGLALSLAALASLGRSFGVLPASRGIQTTGLYRVVRHPVYASYLVLDASLIWALPCPRNLCVGALGLALYLVRMQLEERSLAGNEYAGYAARVRYRLLPLIY